MINENRPFVNGRDTASVPSFILALDNVAKFNNTFLGGETLRIPLKQTDLYALFLPEGGRNFLISNVTPVPVIPSQGTGTDMLEFNVTQNPAIINLADSGMKSAAGNNEIFIKSFEPQIITVLIYGGK